MAGDSLLTKTGAANDVLCANNDSVVFGATNGAANTCEELVGKAGFEMVCRSADQDQATFAGTYCRVTCGLCPTAKEDVVMTGDSLAAGNMSASPGILPSAPPWHAKPLQHLAERGLIVRVGSNEADCNATCGEHRAVCHPVLTKQLSNPVALASLSLAVGCSSIMVDLNQEGTQTLPVISLPDKACITTPDAFSVDDGREAHDRQFFKDDRCQGKVAGLGLGYWACNLLITVLVLLLV